MNKQRYLDMSVGLLMLVGLFSLLFMVLQVSSCSDITGQKYYQVTADFTDIGGLKVRAPVTVAGVKIGEVSRIELRADTLTAQITMALLEDKPIPYSDTSVRILTQGLLGSNYISIVPGFENDDKQHPFLREGDKISQTQPALVLENLIGQFLFNIKK